jgi:hypothetical protein
VQILIWHEIVNDTVGGVPVAVTYCPLCNSALAYDRRVDDRWWSSARRGSLWNSALVMYDRQTETLWSHFTGQAIVGELTGTELDTFPVATVPWGDWRDANPDGLVLSRDTGFDRNYGRNPYPGYDDVDSPPFLFDGEVDGRYTAMTRIVGVELDGDALGVPLVALQEQRVMPATLADTDVVVFWQPARRRHSTPARSPAATTSGPPVCSARGRRSALTFEATATVRRRRDRLDLEHPRHRVDGPLEGSQLDRDPPRRHLLVRLVDVPAGLADRRILLPATDRAALVQVIVVLVTMAVVTTLVRRERALVLLSVGFFLVVLGLMGMRTLH